MRTLTIEPLIPAALWAALALGSAALLLVYALRRPAGVPRWRWAMLNAGMGAAVACVLIVLLNPIWLEQIAPPGGRPRLSVLCDSSASMSAPDAPEQATRYAAAAGLAREIERELGSRYDVQVLRFAEAALPADIAQLESRPADGRATDLAGVLSNVQQTGIEAERAIVLLSDGIHNAGGGAAAVLAAARTSKALSAPIYTQTMGKAAELHDVQLELRSSQELAFIEQEVPIHALIRHVGMAGRQVSAVLHEDGRELERKAVALLASDMSPVHFTVQRRQRGVYRYQVRVEPLSGEATDVNNTASFLLRVIDEPIRILLLEGRPYWDGKFLMRTLAADPSVDVDMRVQLTRDRTLRRILYRSKPAVSTAPAVGSRARLERLEFSDILFNTADALEDAAALDTYQIVIFGRNVEAFLTPRALTNLRAWIARKGGSLVCFRGQPTVRDDDRVASLMPVRWTGQAESRFRVKLTPEGHDVQWLSPAGADSLGLLPSLATLSRPEQPKALAVVLATTQSGDQSVPIISYQPYGTGRVVAIEGSGTWRWAFLPPQHQERQEVYASMWQSLLRWLVSSVGLPPGQAMALTTDRVSFGTGEIASATLLMREETGGPVPSVSLYPHGAAAGAGAAAPAGSRHPATTPARGPALQTVAPAALGEVPGVYRLLFGKLPEGSYEAIVEGAPEDQPGCRTLFDVHSGGQEDLDLQARPDLMARIAAESGGEVLKEGSASEVARLFTEHIVRSRPDRVERTTAWDRWWVLGGILLLWMVAWGFRRSSGLT